MYWSGNKDNDTFSRCECVIYWWQGRSTANATTVGGVDTHMYASMHQIRNALTETFVCCSQTHATNVRNIKINKQIRTLIIIINRIRPLMCHSFFLMLNGQIDSTYRKFRICMVSRRCGCARDCAALTVLWMHARKWCMCAFSRPYGTANACDMIAGKWMFLSTVHMCTAFLLESND